MLHFYKTAIPCSMGGVEQVIDQLSRAIKPLGVSTEVLCLSNEADISPVGINGYTVHRAKLDFELASTGFSLSVLSMFKHLSSKADIVHFHFPWPFMDLVHFVSRHGKPTVVTYHSDIIRQATLAKLYAPLKSCFLNDVGAIVTTSPNYFKTSPVLQKFTHKTSVIPIGLDRATYPKVKKESLNKWCTMLKGPFFLFVGALRYYKGLSILVEAAAINKFPVVIVGAGPMQQELEEKVRSLAIKNVKFLGHLTDEDKVALITLSYGIVFPSNFRSEAFGVSLLEGAMLGKPMISSEIGTGTSLVNIHGKTGLVVESNDPVAFSDAMISLWNDPVKSNAMGLAARERFDERFAASQMADSYLKLYQNLLQSHS